MNNDMSLWAEIINTANKPLSLVALMLLVGMTWMVSGTEFSMNSPNQFAALLGVCIVGVFCVAIYEIASKNNKNKAIKAKEAVILAETLGACIATASHAHISNLDIPEERVQAYARLAAFVKGQEGVTNAEFRGLAGNAIIYYAYTQGGCKKSDIEECISELGYKY
ncbi:MAG: hypothetical protein VX447_04110 [Pseudomonadota bacterium]|uniref:hypothetical protein n=1 Tax=Gallaecimonas pentaromativorans TaxID=584787 RepID=UPI00067E65F9|nr:hypothetical protein [Gallaecimonas pentaromativorans]MED5523926.1 hypothetical protein [Pseudomonadota bacterium]